MVLKRLLLLAACWGLMAGSVCEGALSVVAQGSKVGSPNSTVTTAADTSGANLIVVSLSYYSSVPTLSDSYGNTWTHLTTQTNGAISTRISYCVNPIVGASHTFTSSQTGSYAAVAFVAVSGADSSPLDQQSGANATASTGQPGSITPPTNCIFVASIVTDSSPAPSIDSSFTAQTVAYTSGNSMGGGLGFKISNTAENPTWTTTGSTVKAMRMATFKAAAGGGGGGNGLVYPLIIGQLLRPTPWDRFLAHTPLMLEAR